MKISVDHKLKVYINHNGTWKDKKNCSVLKMELQHLSPMVRSEANESMFAMTEELSDVLYH